MVDTDITYRDDPVRYLLTPRKYGEDAYKKADKPAIPEPTAPVHPQYPVTTQEPGTYFTGEPVDTGMVDRIFEAEYMKPQVGTLKQMQEYAEVMRRQDPNIMLEEAFKPERSTLERSVQLVENIAIGAGGGFVEDPMKSAHVAARARDFEEQLERFHRTGKDDLLTGPLERKEFGTWTVEYRKKTGQAPGREEMDKKRLEIAERRRQEVIRKTQEIIDWYPDVEMRAFDGGVMAIIEDATTGLARSLPIMVGTAINPLLGYGIGVTVMHGQKSYEMLEEGYDAETADKAGKLYAAPAALLETAGAVFGIRAFRTVFGKAGTKIGFSSAAKKKLGAVMQNMVAEGTEEMLQEEWEVIADVYAKNPNASASEILSMSKDIWTSPEQIAKVQRAGLVGGVGGVIPGAAGYALRQTADVAKRVAGYKRPLKTITDEDYDLIQKGEMTQAQIQKKYKGRADIQGLIDKLFAEYTPPVQEGAIPMPEQAPTEAEVGAFYGLDANEIFDDVFAEEPEAQPVVEEDFTGRARELLFKLKKKEPTEDEVTELTERIRRFQQTELTGVDLEIMESEEIDVAAISYKGKVFKGEHHGEAYQALVNEIGEIQDADFIRGEFEEGFVTTTGEFLDRDDAYDHAVEAGQVPETEHKYLISEDLPKTEAIRGLDKQPEAIAFGEKYQYNKRVISDFKVEIKRIDNLISKETDPEKQMDLAYRKDAMKHGLAMAQGEGPLYKSIMARKAEMKGREPTVLEAMEERKVVPTARQIGREKRYPTKKKVLTPKEAREKAAEIMKRFEKPEVKEEVAVEDIETVEDLYEAMEDIDITPEVAEHLERTRGALPTIVKPTSDLHKSIIAFAKEVTKFKKVHLFVPGDAYEKAIGLHIGDTIFLSIEADAMWHTYSHENIHDLVKRFPKLYDQLLDVILPHISVEEISEFGRNLNRARVKQGNKPLKKDKVIEEYIANYVGIEARKPEFWRHIFKKSYDLFDRLARGLMDIIGIAQKHWTDEMADKMLKDTDGVQEAIADIYRQYLEKSGRKGIKKTLPTKDTVVAETYREADSVSKGSMNKNILIRPKNVGTGSGRHLLVQLSSRLMKEEATREGDAYFEKLYKNREGYERPTDFWEVPDWISRMAYQVENADVLVIRNIKDAVDILNNQGYDTVMFSAMDANRETIKSIAEQYGGEIIAGGYVEPGYFKNIPNVKFVDSPDAAVKKIGKKCKLGFSYKHFKGTQTVPRLELSKGCKHKCAFCVVPHKVEEAGAKTINQQVKAFNALDYKLVYLNDKTFGQAKNYETISDIYKQIKKSNPRFQGFIVQTTAPALLKMEDKFLDESGIKYVELGMESFNDDILKKVNKPHTTALIEKAVQKLRDHKINFIPNIIVGLAGVKNGKLWTETEQTYQNTLDFLEQNADIISHTNPYVLAAYEGTGLAEQLETAGDIDIDENVIQKSWMKDKKVHQDFYTKVLEFGKKQLDKKPKAEAVEYLPDFNKPLEEMEEITPWEDLAIQRKIKTLGGRGSSFGDKIKWNIFDIAKAAGGMDPKKIKAYMESKKKLFGHDMNKSAVTYATTFAKNFAKDKAKLAFHKRLVVARERIAKGEIDEMSLEYDAILSEFGSAIEGFTIKHEKRFRFSKEQLFGPALPTDKTTKTKTEHVLKGQIEVESTVDKEGNEVITGPIFPKNKKVRLNQIKAILKKNKQFVDWYARWHRFMYWFEDKHKRLDRNTIEKFIRIQAITSAQVGPEWNQLKFAVVVDSLMDTGNLDDIGRYVRLDPELSEEERRAARQGMGGITGEQKRKIEAIWNDTTTEGISGKALGLSERQVEYGQKIGSYMHAGLFPDDPNAVVLDRHAIKPWGYTPLWTTNGEYTGFKIKPIVYDDVVGDMIAVARDLGIPPNQVQAAVWYESRRPDVHASEYQEAGRLSPKKYLPGIMFEATKAQDLGFGVHYKKTILEEGEYIMAASQDGSVQYNSYSAGDIGQRIDKSTEKNPYQPLVYIYDSLSVPEYYVAQERKAHGIDLSKYNIYDSISDPLGYSETVADRKKLDPQADEINILAGLLRDHYDGFLREASGKGNWVMMFERTMVDKAPAGFDIGVSDVVESIETDLPQTIKEVEGLLGKRGAELSRKIDKKISERYHEVNKSSLKPALSKFEDATGDKLEMGAIVRAEGIEDAMKALFSEIGIENVQRTIFVMRSLKEGEEGNGDFYRFKIRPDIDTFEKVNDKIKEHGLEEFNIGINELTGSMYVEQFVSDDPEITSLEFAEKFMSFLGDVQHKGWPHNTVFEVQSDAIGSFSDDPNDSLEDYKSHIINYHGKKRGQEIYETAIEARERYQQKLAERVGKRAVGEIGDLDEREEIAPEALPGPPAPDEIEEAEETDIERVMREKIGVEKKSIKARTVEAFDDFWAHKTTRTVDKLYPIKEKLGGEAAPYMLHRGIPGVQSTMNALMLHGKLGMDADGVVTTNTTDQGFLKWMKDIGQDGEKAFYWIMAKRAESLEKEGREHWLTPDVRKIIFDWVGDPKGKRSWEQINNEFQEWNQNILDLAITAGLLNEKQIDEWQRDFYIPFYRVFEDQEANAEYIKSPVKGKINLSARVMRLKGAEKKLGDPFENILRNWTHLVNESMSNVARASAYNFAKSHDVPSGLTIINDDGLEEPVSMVEDAKWSDTVLFKTQKGTKATFIETKSGAEVLSFKDKGKTKFFKVNDPELFQALSLVNKEYLDGVLMRMMSGSKRLLTAGATFGPAFRVANMIRDTLHTFQITDKMTFTPFVDTARGFVSAWRQDQDFVDFMASGHAFGGSYVRADDPKAMDKHIKKLARQHNKSFKSIARTMLDTPAKLLELWERVGSASENAARVQLYKNLKKEGKTTLESAFSARDLMDFQMSGNGDVVSFLVATVPFLNARMQGLYRMGRAAVENPKVFFAKGAMITAATMILWWLNHDDERYKSLEDWEKFTYYHFWIGDTHFRIPKPFETGAIFSTMFEAGADVAVGTDDGKHLMQAVVHTLGETFAFNPIPQAVRPITEQWANKSFFTGRPIESQYQQKLKRGERYDPWTSPTLILAGKLGIPPKRAEALIRGFTADIGMSLLWVADIFSRGFADFPEKPTKRIDEYPMIGRFVRQAGPKRSTKYMSKFWDMMKEVDELVTTVNMYKRSGDFEGAQRLAEKSPNLIKFRPYMNKARQQLRKMSHQVKKIWNDPNMSADTKKAEIDKIYEERNVLVKKIYDSYLKDL